MSKSKPKPIERTGEKLVLHSVAFPHSSDEVDEFILVEIVEAKEVRGTWRQQDPYQGYKAQIVGSDRFVYCNWETFPDDSMTPMWSWHEPTHGDYDNCLNYRTWYDVTQGLLTEIPFEPSFVKQWPDVIEWCPRHQRLNYTADRKIYQALNERHGTDPSSCLYCCMGQEPKPEAGAQQKTWQGWR